MKSWEFKTGVVYRYYVSQDLFVVVRMINELDGSHEWLCLTGDGAGNVGESYGNGARHDNDDRWERFALQPMLNP